MNLPRFIEILMLWMFMGSAVQYFTGEGTDWLALGVAAIALAIALAARDYQYQIKS